MSGDQRININEEILAIVTIMHKQQQQLQEDIQYLTSTVAKLTKENEEMKKQLNLNSLIAKSTCPVYDDQERKDALIEVMNIKEKEKNSMSNKLNPDGIFL